MILAILAATTVSTVSLPQTAYGLIAANEEEAIAMRQVASIEQTEAIVRSYFKDIPVMIEVARCESTFRHHLADGSVLQGRVDSDDTGVMQINKRYHESTAIALSLNLDDLYQNMEYARNLYERQGTQPWSASMPCWGKTLAANY
ncbi:MAG: hypothetical protein LR008_00360 [Candidatus Pacebacteria bacterium]|nr:hypothetical protein [Candidatus Paceibacterota bacterium]